MGSHALYLVSSCKGDHVWFESKCNRLTARCFHGSWNPKLVLSVETGVVDCSNVVTGNGRGLIQPATPCCLCGNMGGLKVKCSHDGCAYLIGGRRTEVSFHVTCARMAGLEVNAVDDGTNMTFYGRSDRFALCLTASDSSGVVRRSILKHIFSDLTSASLSQVLPAWRKRL
jgi:hypothetical protein